MIALPSPTPQLWCVQISTSDRESIPVHGYNTKHASTRTPIHKVLKASADSGLPFAIVGAEAEEAAQCP
jgi:hypothetical protein